jgi:hypothetical protein
MGFVVELVAQLPVRRRRASNDEVEAILVEVPAGLSAPSELSDLSASQYRLFPPLG